MVSVFREWKLPGGIGGFLFWERKDGQSNDENAASLSARVVMVESVEMLFPTEFDRPCEEPQDAICIMWKALDLMKRKLLLVFVSVAQLIASAAVTHPAAYVPLHRI